MIDMPVILPAVVEYPLAAAQTSSGPPTLENVVVRNEDADAGEPLADFLT
jgi:hypothetical protein